MNLVGTSNGAIVAAHYAARHPQRVERLAVSTLPLGVPTRPACRVMARYTATKRLRRFSYTPMLEEPKPTGKDLLAFLDGQLYNEAPPRTEIRCKKKLTKWETIR